MPRTVDHEERRRHIVEALLRIVGTQGLDAISLREVAEEAGVSIGAVQHYFATKDEMLGYALRHWLGLAVHRRFTARVQARFDGGAVQNPAALLAALAAEYLPLDDDSRLDARVGAAFLSRAAVDATVADALRPAFTGFADALRAILQQADPALDAVVEARRLAALLDGLRMPVLVGALSAAEALALVDDHLQRLLG